MIKTTDENINPFAAVFKHAFEQDVLSSAVKLPTNKASYPPRAQLFLHQLNRFWQQNGESEINFRHYALNEHKLFEYALFLRGYMRDAQKVLANLKQQHAASNDLIELFQASAEYVVACNHQLHDKRIFDNNASYHTWQINLTNGLKNAVYQKPQLTPSGSDKSALYLFMPFRIEPDNRQISKWVYMNMRNTLDNAPFINDQTDVFAVHYPIQKSRSSNIGALLRTLRHPSDYFETPDLEFVRQNWLPYIADNLQIDAKGTVQTAQPYSPQKLCAAFRRINIFTYCAGTANAHRCLTALQHIGTQIYGNELTQKAMTGIFLCSYGFLPVQPKLPYSGVHIYSHLSNDINRLEPFVNLNNHILYEQTKCTTAQFPAHFSVMPDKRNIVVALRLPNKFSTIKDGNITPYQDSEFGHSMTNINTPNILEADNFAHRLFKSVLQNCCTGKRGKEVLDMPTATPQNIIQTAVLWGNRQMLKL